ncbi:hypothetical protein C9374_003764 [Naegleria lovaniensis]|uniref:Ubiquinone biosynthesis O-methyltransferase, mitochondrial n=1 Tax=Naegleria lovaniensis TaxID=51637 RepID=A0AA88KYG7_NAELO|nr:uncharacterized protein C9374_003764 [Naegleria lovaniensis]KAG2394000.1 hypothetical protein C9374_003764 [Naegleria lovaniensis]
MNQKMNTTNHHQHPIQSLLFNHHHCSEFSMSLRTNHAIIPSDSSLMDTPSSTTTPTAMNIQTTSSIDPNEVNKFSLLARMNEWWNPNGSLKTLHHINPARMEYIRSRVVNHFNLLHDDYKPFKGLTFLDVGCGGGLVSECLARLGASSVIGLDASSDNIMIAKEHGKSIENLEYIHSTVEGLIYKMTTLHNTSLNHSTMCSNTQNHTSGTSVYTHTSFDCIVCLEVIEHVAHAESFIQSLSQLLKPNGLLIMSTMNRTPKSYLQTIVMAEYLLGIVPRGTHDWRKYVTPQEMCIFMKKANIELVDVESMEYNPFTHRTTIGGDGNVDVNYFVVGRKRP